MKGYSDDIYESLEPSDQNLLILDDQMSEASNTKSLANLFTKGSHHRNVTILYLVQNMFDQGRSSRTVSQNSPIRLCSVTLETKVSSGQWPVKFFLKTRTGL